MINIPIELLEQVERGNVLLFIGERILRDAAGNVAFDELAAQLAARAAIAEAERLTFPEIAQLYEDEKKRHGLVQFVKDYFEGLGNAPQAVHGLIAQLADCTVLATTCFDGRFERAFEEAGRRLHPIIGNVDVAFEEEQQTQLYKLRGSLERVESLVLTEDDYETFFEDQASISVVLQGDLARKTILFVGYDLSDPHFKHLYRKVTAPLDNFARRAYAVGGTLPAHTSSWAKRRQIELIEADVSTFLESLTAQLVESKASTPVVAPPPPEPTEPPPERPYKFLDYYEVKDASIFFGRQAEIQRLSSLIHAHRLVLLYGASGVGKTSLLLAGAVPRLKAAHPPYSAIYVRALEDPALVIRRRLRRALPDANLPQNGSLVDFLAAATDALGQTLVIILDQFEEFFIRLSPEFRAAFISQLRTIVDTRNVPVKLVFSLREDWLAAMSEIDRHIPEFLRIRKMRLLPLTREQAHQAITAPVKRLGLSYQRELVKQLLDDLVDHKESTVIPAQLQLVCSALYDERRHDDRKITVGLYERLGSVSGVLQEYLEHQLVRLPANKRGLAHRILEELVTSQGTKAVKSRDELAQVLEVKWRELVPVLERLVLARLLRPLKQETGKRAYELAHEYLIREINLAADTQARKQAQELIQQEVENWQRFRTLLAADKLVLVNKVRDLLRLNNEEKEFMLRSALKVGGEIPYWLNRISSATRRVELLSEVTHNKLPLLRQRAVEMLGTQDIPQSVEPLITRAVRDSERPVRIAARQSLAQLTSQRAITIARLQAEIESGNSPQRPALEALALLPLRGLPFRLRGQVLITRLRLRLAWLLNVTVATPTRQALFMTSSAVALLFALAVTFSANSYHLETKPADILGEDNTIMIQQGHPWLLLPGLDNEIVNTGRSTEDELKLKGFWGFWMQQGAGYYRKWGQDVSEVLKLEDRIQMQWYLGQQEQAVRAIVEATGPQGLELRRKWLPMLAQVEAANPDVAAQIIEPLVELLDDADYRAGARAAQAVGQVVRANPELAAPQLIKRLLALQGDPDRDVRSRAAQAVGQVVQANPELAPQVIESLLALLDDPEWYVRDSAAQALGQVVQANPKLATRQVIEPLLALLDDPERYVRDRAPQALGQLVQANPELSPQLIEPLLLLLADPKPYVRDSAAQAVGQLGQANPELATPQLIEPLLLLLTDPEWHLRASAAQALGQVGQANPEQATPQVIEPLLALLADPKRYVRDKAAQAVGQVGQANPKLATPQVIERLLTLLADPERYVRDSAAQALQQLVQENPEIAPPQLIEPLLGLLDPDSEVHASAAQAVELLVIANPELATQPLIEPLLALLNDPKWDVADSAAQALGQLVHANPQLATPELIKPLVKLLADPERYVHDDDGDGDSTSASASAAQALGQVVQANRGLAPQVIDPLLLLLTDAEWHVRDSAAQAMGQLGQANPELAPKLIEPLLERLIDLQSYVRGSAAQALGQLVQANSELATRPSISMARLLKLLENHEKYVRDSAALAMGQLVQANPELATSELIKPFLEVLTDSKSSLRERDRATKILGQLVQANPELADSLVPLLQEAVNDGEGYVRPRVAWALLEVAKVADAQLELAVIEPPLELLLHSEPELREAARDALARVYAYQALQQEEMNGLLFDQLTHKYDALERPVAARALFLIVLYDDSPSRQQATAIRKRLEDISTSFEPLERIWANRTLQMLYLAEQAHTAANDTDQQDKIRKQWQTFSYLPDTDINFFGEDFTWAAQEAVDWLEEEIKK